MIFEIFPSFHLTINSLLSFPFTNQLTDLLLFQSSSQIEYDRSTFDRTLHNQWNAMSDLEKQPYVCMSNDDATRYQTEVAQKQGEKRYSIFMVYYI